MPRPFGGKSRKRLASEIARSSITSHLAAGLAALVLAVTFPPSQARAAGDDEPDTGAFDEEDVAAVAALKSSRPRWGGLTVEGLMYGRETLATVPFTARGSTNAATPYVQFDSSQLGGDDYAPGLRATLQAEILDQPFAFSAFFIRPMSAEATKLYLGSEAGNPADTDTIYNGDPDADFSSTNSDNIFGMTAHHETKLYGGEANLVRPFGIPGLLVGARAIYFGEQFSTTAIETIDDAPGLGPDNARDHAGIRVDNRLIGLQIGLEHMFDVGDVMRVGGSIKGGLYGNFVDRNRSLVSENRVDRSFESTDHDTVFAQGVEFNPRIEFKLAEGTHLTAAGQFLWLNNVSTALPHYASVANFHSDHDVRADGDVYFYGGSLGLTILLDQSSPIGSSMAPIAPDLARMPPAMSIEDVDARVAELEETTARKGNEKVSFAVSGWINRMVMAWDDGAESNVYVVDNVASRSRINFTGAAQIARGWSAGYILSLGLDDTASNDVDQNTAQGDGKIDLRQSAWWIRNSQLGTVTVGLASTATDNIILKDVGGIMPGAANIATIGGSILVRRADSYEQGDDALVSSGAYTTTLNDFSAGASVDTLRRNNVRYDAPRFSGQWGNVDLSAAWGEDDFYDFALEHSINYSDWRFRFGAGYLRDTTEGRPGGQRDREEYKGSASLLHIPTGLFGTVAYVHREFHGVESSDQAVFGENISEELDSARPNRPPIDYLYSAFGLRRAYWSIGDTSIYGEYAHVDDAITGLREAGLRAVTDSSLQMFGAAISQDIDAAGMDLYAGFRTYQFDAVGVQRRSVSGSYVYYTSPVPLTDLMIGYAGTRIKF